jgi:hypothetical protein
MKTFVNPSPCTCRSRSAVRRREEPIVPLTRTIRGEMSAAAMLDGKLINNDDAVGQSRGFRLERFTKFGAKF